MPLAFIVKMEIDFVKSMSSAFHSSKHLSEHPARKQQLAQSHSRPFHNPTLDRKAMVYIMKSIKHTDRKNGLTE
jgi:hypothetical protein